MPTKPPSRKGGDSLVPYTRTFGSKLTDETLASAWLNAHVPFVCAYVLAGAAMSKLVVATDTPNAPLETLTEFYQHRAHDHVSEGLRWYYCGGFGVALLSMTCMALSHHHKRPPRVWLSKRWRLANRVAAAIVFFTLPLAHDLTSLSLLGISTGILVWVLIVELWGGASMDESFVGDFGRPRGGAGAGGDEGGAEAGGDGDLNDGQGGRCYHAQCTRKQLEQALKEARMDAQTDISALDVKTEKTGTAQVG